MAIDAKEIVSPNLLFFYYHFSGTTDAVVNYLNATPEGDVSVFLEKQFIQYWRSIVNF